jgi:hypothetical protein
MWVATVIAGNNTKGEDIHISGQKIKSIMEDRDAEDETWEN